MDQMNLWLPVEPLPKERPRFFKGHTYTPARTRKYEGQLKKIMLESKPELLKGPISVGLVFKRSTNRLCDIDNLQKCVFDAANGILWEDDRQIRSMWAMVQYKQPKPGIALYWTPW